MNTYQILTELEKQESIKHRRQHRDVQYDMLLHSEKVQDLVFECSHGIGE